MFFVVKEILCFGKVILQLSCSEELAVSTSELGIFISLLWPLMLTSFKVPFSALFRSNNEDDIIINFLVDSVNASIIPGLSWRIANYKFYSP